MSGAFERLTQVLPEEATVDERGQLTVGGIPLRRRPADPDANANEVRIRQVLDKAAETVVSTVSAALLQLHSTYVEVEIIVDDNHVRCRQFVEP